MNGVVARRNNFNEPILGFIEQCAAEFGRLTGRHYDFITEYKTEDADTVFVSLGCAADNIEAACDYLREQRNAKVGSVHINVIRPFPRPPSSTRSAARKTSSSSSAPTKASPVTIRWPATFAFALGKANENAKFAVAQASRLPSNGAGGDACASSNASLPALTPAETPRLFRGAYGIGSRDFRPEHSIGAYEFATGASARKDGRRAADGETFFVLGVDHPYAVISKDTPSLLPEGAIAVRFHSIGGWGMITTGKTSAPSSAISASLSPNKTRVTTPTVSSSTSSS